MSNETISFVYFGGEPIGVPVLEELKQAGFVPKLVICSPDKPVGRKQILTAPPVKEWAHAHNISTWQPESWKSETTKQAASEILKPIIAADPQTLFVVVAYNHILPQWLLDLSQHGVINVHPSLLPKLRGASPIRTALMHNLPEQVGVSIMLLDDKMDHGPILTQLPMDLDAANWPIPGPDLDNALAHMGGALLADTLPKYLAGEIDPTEQNHDEATYCTRLTKADSQLNITPEQMPRGDAANAAYAKIQAFAGIGDTWFLHNNKRIKIKEAQLINDELRLLTVVPEGKKPQSFETWIASKN